MTDRPETAREFLESCRGARLEHRRCEWRIAQLDAQARSITTSLRDATGGGGSGDPHHDGLLVALADQRVRLEELAREAASRQLEVERFIERLSDAAHRVILQLRYCDLLSWGEVQEAMKGFGLFYGDRQMFRLHDQAMTAAEAMWKEDHGESVLPEAEPEH